MTKIAKMPSRPSAHVIADVDGVSKDEIVVIGGPFVSGTVLGKLTNGNFTKLDIAEGATEAHEAAAVLYGHIETDVATGAIGHARVCALNAERITWPDAITAERKTAEVARLAVNQIVLR